MPAFVWFRSMVIPVAVLGASGYAGAEALRLLLAHPDLEVTVATADTQAGLSVASLYPNLLAYGGLAFRHYDDCAEDVAACRLVLCGLPHGEAMALLPALTNDIVVDIGGDFRLDNADTYQEWYGVPHSAAGELAGWTYGLTELFREKIVASKRIANPGCYPTASVLAVAPLVQTGLVEGTIVVDAMSGTSGGGRAPKPNLHFAHVDEDVRAYKLAQHQHTPEMEHALRLFCNADVTVSFTAHLVPATRGIHATVTAPLAFGVTEDQVREALDSTYAHEPFVHVVDEPPGTKDVRGSNLALVHAKADGRAGRVIVTCVIDNLVKGAAGQAIQNANLALGLDEAAGLPIAGVYP
jgi:N-acetyl-gamma-glutamyl-phosphate reductase